MKSEEQIVARIEVLRRELKQAERRRKDYARGKGNRGTLGMRGIREREGEISGLQWVLENGQKPSRDTTKT
jgi:hypothetical protein